MKSHNWAYGNGDDSIKAKWHDAQTEVPEENKLLLIEASVICLGEYHKDGAWQKDSGEYLARNYINRWAYMADLLPQDVKAWL